MKKFFQVSGLLNPCTMKFRGFKNFGIFMYTNGLKNWSKLGFSLVELMVVVGIIGILATLVFPRFKQFQAKAKMSEPKTILQHIYMLEQSYMFDTHVYAPVGVYGADTSVQSGPCVTTGASNSIGFKIEPCGKIMPRYNYSAWTNGPGAFTVVAGTGSGNNNRICLGNGVHFFGTDEDNSFGSIVAAIPTSGSLPFTQDVGVAVLCPY